MSFKRGSFPSASEFIALKSRVKAEMLRRNGNGSLVTYGSSVYDYSIIPKKGDMPKIEHYSKIRDVQANINVSGLPSNKKRGDCIGEFAELEAKQTVFEAQPRGQYGSGNDCSGACSGMCVTACTTTCTGGCTGGCSGTCSGGCTGCSGSCSGGCTSCSGGCSGCSGCTGCTGTCSGTCTGDCTGGCSQCPIGCGSNPCFGSCTGGNEPWF